MAEARPFSILPVLAWAVALAWAFFKLHHVLMPFVLSAALAYVAAPWIDRVEARGLRRGVTVLAIYVAISVGIGLLANRGLRLAASQLDSLKSQAPTYVLFAEDMVGKGKEWAVKRLPYGKDLVKNWDFSLYEPLAEEAQNIPKHLLGIFPLLSFLFLIPFITFFMLIDGPSGIDRLIQVIPARYVEQVLHLISEIDTSLGNYLRGILIEAAMVGALSFAGLWFLGVQHALAIAVISGLGSFVPYLGPLIGGSLGAIVAVLQFGTVDSALQVILLFLLIRLADDVLVQPIIARHSVHLHPLTFLVALMIGGELFGFVGLVFGIPVACILKSLVAVVWGWYSTGTGLEKPDLMKASTWPYT